MMRSNRKNASELALMSSVEWEYTSLGNMGQNRIESQSWLQERKKQPTGEPHFLVLFPAGSNPKISRKT